jgi:D-3-phosphoglycerate dehydrogenase
LKDSPLQKLENVILTPHIAGSTNEAQEAVGQQIAMQVKEYLKHGVIQNSVNVPSVSFDEYLLLKPYVTLAERLGSFLAQISESSVESISLSYTGHITEWKTELIRNAAIKGILNVAVEDKANLVNAASLAAERGLTIHEEKKPKASTGGAGSVLTITIKTEKAMHVVKGAVLREGTPRLLHVDGIDAEAPLEQNLIYMRNEDVPGVIGKVGTILGKHGINIANFSLGRRSEEASAGGPRDAIAVVQVDGSVPDAVISELKGVPAIQQAKPVRLAE